MELRLPMQGNPTCEPIQVIRANNQTHIHTDKYIPWQSQCNLLPLFISVTAVAESRSERGREEEEDWGLENAGKWGKK